MTMHTALNREAVAEGDDAFVFEAVPGAISGLVRPPASASPYSYRAGPNWLAVATIVGLHLGALIALVKLDIIHIEKAVRKDLVVVNLSEPAPPPLVKPEPQKADKVEPKIVTPVPMVQTIAPPPQMAVTDTPPPPKAIIAPAAAPPALPAAGPVMLDELADPISRPSFLPPKFSRKDRGPHTVRLQLIIGTNGAVEQSAVVSSSGVEDFDQAALRWVKRWRFKPVIRDGVAVEARGNVPITIDIN